MKGVPFLLCFLYLVLARVLCEVIAPCSKVEDGEKYQEAGWDSIVPRDSHGCSHDL